MYQNLHDNHNHTRHFSPDARQTLDDLIQDAARNGLSGFTLTEHYDKDMVDGCPIHGISDYGAPAAEGEWVFDFNEYSEMVIMKQAELARRGSSLKFLKGIEVGYMPYQNPDIWQFLAKHFFDTVICSVHCIDEADIFANQSPYANGRLEAYGKYLNLIHEMLAANLDFDIVGHYDYVTRYYPGTFGHLQYRDFPDILDEIFRLLISQGKALELNTRNRYRLLASGEADIGLQDMDVFRRYRELGGEFVALSSDSHEDHNAGNLFQESAAYLERAGFKYLTHYEKRKPVPIKIS